MKITRIHVLRSSNFNNVTLEAELAESELIAEVYGELVVRCEALLSGVKNVETLREERRQAEWAIGQLRKERNTLESEVEDLRRDVKRIGKAAPAIFACKQCGEPIVGDPKTVRFCPQCGETVPQETAVA